MSPVEDNPVRLMTSWFQRHGQLVIPLYLEYMSLAQKNMHWIIRFMI